MAELSPEQRERNRESWRRWAAKNKDYLLTRHRDDPNHNARGNGWRKKNPKGSLLINARSRCSKSGVEFNLTEDDFEIPEVCPALGITLVCGQGKPIDSSPSLDRIDATKGYVPGNVQVISYLANSIKYTATAEQILAVGHFVQKSASKEQV